VGVRKRSGMMIGPKIERFAKTIKEKGGEEIKIRNKKNMLATFDKLCAYSNKRGSKC
jgi:hypothetical protein